MSLLLSRDQYVIHLDDTYIYICSVKNSKLIAINSGYVFILNKEYYGFTWIYNCKSHVYINDLDNNAEILPFDDHTILVRNNNNLKFLDFEDPDNVIANRRVETFNDVYVNTQGIAIGITASEIYRFERNTYISYVYPGAEKIFPGFNWVGTLRNGVIENNSFNEESTYWSITSGYVSELFIIVITSTSALVIPKNGSYVVIPNAEFVGMTDKYILIKDLKWYYKVHTTDTHNVKVSVVFGNTKFVNYNQGSDIVVVEYSQIIVLHNRSDISVYTTWYICPDKCNDNLCSSCYITCPNIRIFKAPVITETSRNNIKNQILKHSTIDQDSAELISRY